MNFLDFARIHGVLIDHLPPIGVWRRYPTEDKPRHKNGAAKYMGDHGFIQNHATMTEVAVWRPEKPVELDLSRIRRDTLRAQQETLQRQQEAVRKAAWILDQCKFTSHPYLRSKGFDDEPGQVWVREGEHILCIPMRVDGRLVGLQMIDEAGGKKFLLGQRTSEAEFVWDNKGPHILCEGYATSMSIRMILKALKRRYTIHVCFSAGNMLKIARKLSAGMVVADNDASGTGERVAQEIGWPYFMPPEVGQDFNDLHQTVGNFRAGQELAAVLLGLK
jgi:putative DNA primase/helicase